jgi:hypothetical protein
MLKRIDSPDGVVALEVVGRLQNEDYETMVIPAIDDQLGLPGRLRFVFVLAEDADAPDEGALLDDAVVHLSSALHRDTTRWRRCAIVADPEWLQLGNSLLRWMLPGEVELYEPSAVGAAMAWAAA